MKNQTCLGSFPHSFGNTSLQGFTLLWVNYLPKIARHFRNVKIGEFFPIATYSIPHQNSP